VEQAVINPKKKGFIMGATQKTGTGAKLGYKKKKKR
jgi:hypothetical protein